ncbi:MAG: dynamin family protein [Synergistaceae bacterium]|jgi:PAS domain-containing protein|nr:dynamin family protein [Synergistaceae bacterium]
MTEVSGRAFQDESVWQKFLKHTRESIIDVDFRTRRIRYSSQFISSVKLTPETLPHAFDQWFELYHPDDYAKSLEFRRRVFESDEDAFSVERRLYCGDGRYHWFRMDAFCLRDKKGKIRRLIGVETDIAPQKLDEQNHEEQRALVRGLEEQQTLLREENRRLGEQLSQKDLRCQVLEKRLFLATQMVNAAPSFLFHREASGRLTFCNDAFAEALARNPHLLECIDLARPKESGEKSQGEWELEDGSYEDAHGRLRSLTAALRPFVTPGGRAEGVIGMMWDVTEIREMEGDMARLKRLLGKNTFYGNTNENLNEKTFRDFSEMTFSMRKGEEREKGDTEEYPYSLSPDESGEEPDSREIMGKYLDSVVSSLSNPLTEKLFPARKIQIENLLRATEAADLEVGVVGITSSGKSTFINAMMGERLLPEETRATTHRVIRCRKGETRAVTVVFQNGERERVFGARLTPQWMESLTSERMNPFMNPFMNSSNEQAIAFLEWTSPGAAFPEGLVLVDTPGLDACDFPEHSEFLLRRLLPTLDIVIYVTSIRNRFKTPDLQLLEAVLEQDQRVVFLLSQIDLERDDMEGGKVVLSRRQKLSAYVRELRLDIESRFGGSLGSAAIVPVSSKLAMTHFYDRQSAAWNASNFGVLIGQLAIFRSNLVRYRIEARARRALTLLSRTASDVKLALDSVSAEKTAQIPLQKTEPDVQARLEKIRNLRDAQRWVSAEISAVRNEWRRILDPGHHLERLRKIIESANTVKSIKDRYEKWGEECADLIAQMISRMDRARHSCRDILQGHGMVPEDRALGMLDVRGELPAFSRYLLQEVQEVRVRGWFEELEFWPKYKMSSRQNVDRAKMLEGVKDLLSERMRFLNDHLSWWENRMREDYCDPLYAELEREEVALADIRRVAAESLSSREALSRLFQDLRAAESGIKNSVENLFLPQKSSGHPDGGFCPLDEDSVFAWQDEGNQDSDRGQGLFAPLLAAFHEQDIQSRFLKLDALRLNRRVVLLGLRRHDSLRLLSRLAHDAASTDALRTQDGREIGERDWLFCGSTPPALPHVRIDTPDTLLRDLDVLVAPDDALCDSEGIFPVPVDWGDIFAEWLPVIHLDIARVDSGLSDLARAPYVKALSHVDLWVAASGQGALFNGRLPDLLTDVPQRLELFLRNRDCRGRAEWFVYENYDARYTDFMSWGRELQSGDDALLRKWIESGHDFELPFSKPRLKFALEAARRKSAVPPRLEHTRMEPESAPILEPILEALKEGSLLP